MRARHNRSLFPCKPPRHLLRTCRLVGGSNTTVTRRLPQAGHISRDSRRESGKFGPRVPNQRLKIELLAIDAPPHGPGAFTIAISFEYLIAMRRNALAAASGRRLCEACRTNLLTA